MRSPEGQVGLLLWWGGKKGRGMALRRDDLIDRRTFVMITNDY